MDKIDLASLLPLFGHKKQMEFLRGLLSEGRMPSGLLFHGQKNIGKKFAATVFAASVLCRDYSLYAADARLKDLRVNVSESAPAIHAMSDFSLDFCGKCPSCVSILNGLSQSLLIVESSGNSIKIESVHKIDAFLSLSSVYPGYRFVIIDEVSDMNASAANALLKILEEPPANTVFILVSSRLSMILPTIISRCQLLGFSPLSSGVLFNAFKSEFPDTGDETLKLYSRLAKGSYSNFRAMLEGRYLEKRKFLIDTVFNEIFEGFKNKSGDKNPYDISSKFNAAEKEAKAAGKKEKIPKSPKKSSDNPPPEANADKTADFELILFILRDILIYNVSKNEKLLYNEDIAAEIKRFAVDSGAAAKDIARMIEYTVEHIEKTNAYNLNKTISLDSYFSKLLAVK
jgi:hypothetical protein